MKILSGKVLESKKTDHFFIGTILNEEKKNILETFRTEQKIIEFAYNQLKTDKWAKTHCIGFGFDKNEAEQLRKILNEMNVEYFQDQIPYYPDKPTYRTFVLGCGILKVENLKTKYYKSPK